MKKWLLFTLIFICTTCFAQIPEELLQRAQAGDANAQFNLGVMHYNGHNVPQDFTQAKAWFEKAAHQGHAKAQYNLGIMYDEGHGVPKSKIQSMQWFKQACDNGLQQGCTEYKKLSGASHR